MIVDFYADWCGPCKAGKKTLILITRYHLIIYVYYAIVAPVFSAISDLYAPEKMKFFKADTDVHEELIDKYKLQGLPLFAIFKEGKIVASHSGALTKDKLSKFVDKALS